MKITHIKNKPAKAINVAQAKYLDGYRLQISFDDGKTRIIDFEPFLRNARNPMTAKYLDLRKFKQFKIDWGNLSWNEREMIFPIIQLYRGKIELAQQNKSTSIASNNHELLTGQLSVPNATLQKLKVLAKKEDVPLELLAQRYLEEAMGRHGERA